MIHRRVGLALRLLSVSWSAALLATGCLGDLGLFTGGEGDIATGGRSGAGGLDGGSWPDGAKPDAAKPDVDSDATGFGGSDSASSCGGFDLALDLVSPYCGSCMDQACCPPLEACAGDAECVAIVACVTACPATDSTCSDSCVTQHPNGTTNGVPVANCANQNCRNDCAHCGGLGSLISLGATCDACVASHCCSEAAACGHDPLCAGYAECWVTCPSTDSACLAACEAQFPGGSQAVQPVASCMAQNCANSNCMACGALDVTFGATPECGACIAQNCCKTAAECANDTDCIAFLKCSLACPTGDTACSSTCQTNHPNGKLIAEGIANCLAQVTPPCPC